MDPLHGVLPAAVPVLRPSGGGPGTEGAVVAGKQRAGAAEHRLQLFPAAAVKTARQDRLPEDVPRGGGGGLQRAAPVRVAGPVDGPDDSGIRFEPGASLQRGAEPGYPFRDPCGFGPRGFESGKLRCGRLPRPGAETFVPSKRIPEFRQEPVMAHMQCGMPARPRRLHVVPFHRLAPLAEAPFGNIHERACDRVRPLHASGSCSSRRCGFSEGARGSFFGTRTGARSAVSSPGSTMSSPSASRAVSRSPLSSSAAARLSRSSVSTTALSRARLICT